MNRHGAIPDDRGGGDTTRRDAFRYAPGGTVLAILALVGLGVTAIVLVAYDVGGARETPEADWVAVGGLLLILFALGLAWIAKRRPVLLAVGPDGLDLPAAFERPVPWTGIHRIRRAGWRVSLFQKLAMLKVELVDGVRPSYKRRLWTMPAIDGWIARRFGLTVPLRNLDAEEEVIIASVERFKPVQRVAA